MINNILTYWFKVKLSHNPMLLPSYISKEDKIIIQLYEEYEERKRLKKINFLLLFNEEYWKESSYNNYIK
jgi:hypothetical protein